MTAAERLRVLLQRPQILVLPGAYDALTARLAEQAGFEAVYMTGAGLSYTALGRPDIGLLTLTEMAEQAGRIVAAVKVPVVADADTGYGNAHNVMRTVSLYERNGVAGIQFEDQLAPKRCGHLRGKEVILADEMVQKIEAACRVRQNPATVIIARTDARATHGLAEAIRRARLYAEAGADLLFVEALETEAEMAEVCQALPLPCVVNLVEGGRTPLLPTEALGRLGFKVALFPNSVTRTVAQAAQALYQELRRSGSTAAMSGQMLTFRQLNDLLGLAEFEALDTEFRSVPQGEKG